MDLKRSHTYSAPIDAVVAMLSDPDAVVAKYEGMGHRDVEILDCTAAGGSIRVESKRVVDVDLPGFAKKFLTPTNTMHQTDQWNEADDGSWSGEFTVEVDGAPIQMSGTLALEAGDGTCTQVVAITMNVKVPLVGGRIADWAGQNDVPRTLDAEFAFGDGWLADHPV